jgi:alpha-tubulin suppressor-like RCC1 family protein
MAHSSAMAAAGVLCMGDGSVQVFGGLDPAAGVCVKNSAPQPLPCTRPTAVITRYWTDNGRPVSEKKVLSADIGPYTGAFVTDEGEVFGFGLGTVAGHPTGGHGLGHSGNVDVPTRLRGGLERERAVLVRMGSIFGIALTQEGHVWSFGTSRSGQLGTGVMATKVWSAERDVVSNAADNAETVWDTADAEVAQAAWGHAAVLGPTLLSGALRNHKVAHVSCGAMHTVVCTHSGRALSWGMNEVGQLGLGHTRNCCEPTLIEGALGEETVVFTASSCLHNAVVTLKNEVWVWGLGAHGQLGLGRGPVHFLTTPERVPNVFNAFAVSCHETITYALQKRRGRGEVWVWGRGHFTGLDKGMKMPLGIGGYSQALKPTRICGALASESITSISCGRFHVSVVSETGAVFTWGRGKVKMDDEEDDSVAYCGAHGHGEEDVLVPRLLTHADGQPLAPVGRLRPLAQDMALALACASHPRLGAASPARVLMPEVLRHIVGAARAGPAGLSSGVVRQLGGTF